MAPAGSPALPLGRTLARRGGTGDPVAGGARRACVLPRHRGTTANLSSLYPWHTGPGPDAAGPYLGVNVTGGGTGWFYDPFELYGGALTDSNVLIAGRPGKGKSTRRQDVPLPRDRRLRPASGSSPSTTPRASTARSASGSACRSSSSTPAARTGSTRSTPRPATATTAACSAASGSSSGCSPSSSTAGSSRLRSRSSPSRSPTSPSARQRFDLARPRPRRRRPARPSCSRTPSSRRSTEIELRAAAMPVRFALGKLLDRTLRGMFDGPTTVSVDWEQGAGVVIDLSAVFQDREALPLVMMAATSWLQSAMTALAPGPTRAAGRRRGVGAARQRVDRAPPAGPPQAVPPLGDLQHPRVPPALGPAGPGGRRHRRAEARRRPARRHRHADLLPAGTRPGRRRHGAARPHRRGSAPSPTPRPRAGAVAGG